MQINSISYFPKTQTNFKGILPYRNTPDYDTFEKSLPQNTSFYASNDLKLFKLMPKIIRDLKFNSIPKECKDAAFDSIIAGKALKEKYDETYGENNYVFVSIGTSPAPIARCMEFLGTDIRYVPISGLKKINFPISDLTEYQDYNKYSQFLNSLGLTRKKMQEDGRKFIFCDYTASGKTLDAVEYYAKYRKELPEKQIEFHSLNVDMTECSNKHKKSSAKILKYMDSISRSDLSKYSGIPHIDCLVVDSIEEGVKAPRKKEAKDFNFAMLYMMNEKNLLP